MSTAERGSAEVCVSIEEHESLQDRILITKCRINENCVGIQPVVPGRRLRKNNEEYAKQHKVHLFCLPNQHNKAYVKKS